MTENLAAPQTLSGATSINTLESFKSCCIGCACCRGIASSAGSINNIHKTKCCHDYMMLGSTNSIPGGPDVHAGNIIPGSSEEKMLLPMRITLELPGYLYKTPPTQYVSDLQFDDQRNVWQSSVFIYPSHCTVSSGSNDTSIPDETTINLLDFRHKESHISVQNEGKSFSNDPEMSQLRSQTRTLDWHTLDQLEMKALTSANLHTSFNQTSFFKYLGTLLKTVERFKNELEVLDIKSNKQYNAAQKFLSKEQLLEIVHNRLLRKDVRQELEFLETAIRQRVIMLKKDFQGKLTVDLLGNFETVQDRYSRAVRAIAETLEILKEQVEQQSIPVEKD